MLQGLARQQVIDQTHPSRRNRPPTEVIEKELLKKLEEPKSKAHQALKKDKKESHKTLHQEPSNRE